MALVEVSKLNKAFGIVELLTIFLLNLIIMKNSLSLDPMVVVKPPF